MRFGKILTCLGFQLLTANAMAIDANSEHQTARVDEPSPPSVHVDPYKDLFPGPGNGTSPLNTQPQIPAQPPAPVYESWDVLRQYPRLVPLPPPTLVDEI